MPTNNEQQINTKDRNSRETTPKDGKRQRSSLPTKEVEKKRLSER